MLMKSVIRLFGLQFQDPLPPQKHPHRRLPLLAALVNLTDTETLERGTVFCSTNVEKFQVDFAKTNDL